MTKGYMVFVHQGYAPNKVHKDYDYALKEAERLAKKNPDCVVTVLEIKQQMIGRVQVVDI